MGGMLHLAVPWWELILRSVGVYVVLLFGLRLFGKRQVGQFTLFDLVFVLLVANAVQPAMTGPDSSLLGGLIIIGALLTANWIVGRLDDIPAIHRLLAPEPTLLVEDGKSDPKAMEKEGINEDEILMALREHGFDALDQVKLVMLESDGSLSVVGKDAGSGVQRRRRTRFIKHN